MAQALAVLLDRDGTIIVDLRGNADPSKVTPMPYARSALQRLRHANILTAVISNQSGVALGQLTSEQVRAVNVRAEQLLGPLGPIFICEHSERAGCDCRKPNPGLVFRAAMELGVHPEDCVVIGDIGTDMDAARAAGARGILIPTASTRPEEVLAAPAVALHLDQAVDSILAGNI
ncbi:MAG TPA: HAD-IIIA family hydrolase [Candidatus Tumulicola sp.]|jgi:histidinol-phosphate phosphatase family protein